MGTSTIIKRVLPVSCLILCAQCISEKDITGLYKPTISIPEVEEWIIVKPDNTYFYHYSTHRKYFTNRGRWKLETSNGYTYLMMNGWRMIKPPCTIVSGRKPAFISFAIDGESIAIINDLPDCTYNKQENY